MTLSQCAPSYLDSSVCSKHFVKQDFPFITHAKVGKGSVVLSLLLPISFPSTPLLDIDPSSDSPFQHYIPFPIPLLPPSIPTRPRNSKQKSNTLFSSFFESRPPSRPLNSLVPRALPFQEQRLGSRHRLPRPPRPPPNPRRTRPRHDPRTLPPPNRECNRQAWPRRLLAH